MKDKKPSKKSSKQPLNEQLLPIDEDIKDVLRSALASFLKDQIDERNNSRKNTEALIHVVQEFLNSFIILGYTMDGIPVQFICAHNQQQADSLATLVNKFFQHALLRNDFPEND
jgi:mevalonate pyrophosphate decarboxylase